MLVYVTGLSGSGKSSVLLQLKKRGYEAHGVDEEGYADWVDRMNGQCVRFPHGNPEVKCRTLGASIVDATKPLDDVVDSILSKVKPKLKEFARSIDI
jgi:thymidylate kinase